MVTGIAHRRPQGESYDQAIRNDSTGLWQCPFCQQDNFPELSEVPDEVSSLLNFLDKNRHILKAKDLPFFSAFRCGIILTAARVQVRPLVSGPD